MKNQQNSVNFHQSYPKFNQINKLLKYEDNFKNKNKNKRTQLGEFWYKFIKNFPVKDKIRPGFEGQSVTANQHVSNKTTHNFKTNTTLFQDGFTE